MKRKRVFRFEKMWLELEKVEEVVKQSWSLPVRNIGVASIIVKKLGRLRKTLKKGKRESLGISHIERKIQWKKYHGWNC